MNYKFELDCPKCQAKDSIKVETWHYPQTYDEPEDGGLEWGNDCNCDFTKEEWELFDKLLWDYIIANERLQDVYQYEEELKLAIEIEDLSEEERNGIKTNLFEEHPKRIQEAEAMIESCIKAIIEAFL